MQTYKKIRNIFVKIDKKAQEKVGKTHEFMIEFSVKFK